MRIRVLPQTLINQIAAGEVVVRMANVVKELVENSIDAGARHIEVLISNDARDVEVRDDGCGMSREDAELSLQRHATSKIRTIEDLMAVQTRGFRGEAVPSIASVSRMEIQTREPESLSGTRLQIEGGRIQRIEPFGCPPGTRFLVRDLFFNTPARLKFLKTPVGEANAILSTITRHALAVPHIGFSVGRDGREALKLPPDQPLADRFASVLGSQIKRAMLPLEFARENVVVHGILAHPHDARSDRRSQYLFINGRPFSSKQISFAIEQACRGFVMASRFPVFCIFIELPADEVDINVHPTKEEVRFRDERAVAGAAFRAIEQALQGSSALVAQVTADDIAPPPSSEPRAASQVTPAVTPPPGFFTPEQLVRRSFDLKQSRAHQPDWLAQSESFASAPAVPSLPPARTLRVAHGDGTDVAAGPGEQPDNDFWGRGYEPEPLGQIAETYVLVRFGDDLLIVDQHASHERLRYLELKKQQRTVEAQSLLVPITLELAPAQSELMHDLLPHFAGIGIDVEEFGQRTWAVQSLPADLPEFDPVPLIIDLLDDYTEARRINALEALRDRILIRMACHSAIRAGERLPMEVMVRLLSQIRNERLSFTCPHGRPTILRMGKRDLDKLFKRIA